MFLWCVRDGWRDIYSERGLLLPVYSSRNQGVPTFALPCKLIRDASARLHIPRSTRFSALCLNLTKWFSSHDLLPVTHLLYLRALIALLFTNHNMTACQSTRGHQKRTLLSRLGLQNTLTAPLLRGKTPTTSVLDMTLNDLMVRFQQCWIFGECGVPLHCHCSQVHSGPEWQHQIGPYIWVKQN